LANDDGSAPLKPELSIYNSSSLNRFPSSEGREPLKLFEPKPLKINPKKIPCQPHKVVLEFIFYEEITLSA
jgi:hypothetical protein